MIREAGCNEVDGRRVSLQLGIWTIGRLRVRGILMDTYLGGRRVSTREIIPGEYPLDLEDSAIVMVKSQSGYLLSSDHVQSSLYRVKDLLSS